MQLKRVPITLGMLAVVVAGGLFLGPAGFGPGERSAEAVGLSEVKKLLASDAQTADNFGFSVAVSVDNAVVGAYREDAGGDDAGAVYVLGRDAGGANNWGEVKKLIASDSEDFDHFGQSVAISGDTAIVGADFEGGGAAGAVYIFQRDQGGADNWGEVKKLLASDAEFPATGSALAWPSAPTRRLWGHTWRIPGAASPALPTSSSATRAAPTTGVR